MNRKSTDRMKNCSWNSATETNHHCAYGRSWQGLVLLLGALTGVILVLQGCRQPPPAPEPPAADRIGAVKVYVFEPDSQDYLAAPRLFPLDAAMSPADALTALGDHLGHTYFRTGSDSGAGAIRFEVEGVHRFRVAQRAYRLAVINMVDPQLEARQGFFQGSAGGLTTYYMLAATFLQPQLDPPLVDGLILLYNGKEFPETDHVNLRGIVTPQAIRPVVTKTLYRYRPDGSTVTG
jgi:hypothetical protein